MKKSFILFSLLLVFMFIFPVYEVAFADSGNRTYVVTANTACVYSSPSLASKKLALYKNKDKVTLAESVENDGYKFFKLQENVIVDDVQYGYILADFVVEETNEIMSIPNFNAKTNSKCDVFFAEETSDGILYNKSDISLDKGENIFLYQGFKSKTKYTAVSFLKDNQIYYGYLQTKDVSPNGVNPIILTCIFLTIAVLGIVFAWVFMSRKKIKLKGKKVKSEYNLKETN